MTPSRHAKMQEIFEAALDLPESERSVFLDEICGGDAELRSRVGALIEAAEEDGTETVDSGPSCPESARSGSEVLECPSCARCYDGPQLTCSHDGTRLEAAFPGTLLIDKKYRVERRLGRGGMGAVYLVTHVGLEKRFALKMILSQGVIPRWTRKGFETEARALGRLKHPNIVDVSDYGVDVEGGGVAYLVMEYLEGCALADVLNDRGALPFDEAIPILRTLGRAIDAAHAQNIVHGDLKPANIFVARGANGAPTYKVVDFGLARLNAGAVAGVGVGPDAATDMDSTFSSTRGYIRGTPPYMAPELFRGEPASTASDCFALGAMVYEILTGGVPFGRTNRDPREIREQLPENPSRRNPSLPVDLDAQILAMLSPAPEHRPPSASAAISALESAWVRARQHEWKSQGRWRRLGASCAAAMLALLVAVPVSRIGLLQALEDRTVDARLALLPKHAPDSRLVVVSVDEPTLEGNRMPLGDVSWGDQFGETIEHIFASGARAIALDLLMPQTWSDSQRLARTIAVHADRLAIGLLSTSSGVRGVEAIGPLTERIIGPERFDSMFGFVNIEEDQDRIVRRARVSYIDRVHKQRLTLASRSAIIGMNARPNLSSDVPFWIDYSNRVRDIPKVSWKDVLPRLGNNPDLFKGKLVMIGADYEADGDDHRVPRGTGSGVLPGELIQAVIANTIADRFPIHDFSLTESLAIVAALCYAITQVTLRFPHRSGRILAAAAAIAVLFPVFGFALFRFSQTMVRVTAPEIAIVLAIVAAWRLKTVLPPYPTPRLLFPEGW